MQALLGQNGIFLACPSDKVGGETFLHRSGRGRRLDDPFKQFAETRIVLLDENEPEFSQRTYFVFRLQLISELFLCIRTSIPYMIEGLDKPLFYLT